MKNKRGILKGSLLLFMSLFLVACGGNQASDKQSSEESQAVIIESAEDTGGKKADSKSGDTITIRSVGDILIHDTVYEAARTENGYDFTGMFEPVKEYLQDADITTANLEVIAAGSQLGVSSYPLFNAPEEIIDALKDSGVDIVNNATNHTMDFGAEGAHASLDNLQERDMMYVGSYESWDDYNTPRIIEVGDVKVGFLSYANDANGNPIPEDEAYLLSLIDEELIPLEVEALNEKVDISVVMYSMGEEYEPLPNNRQLDVFQMTRDSGANFILGGHPHVIQPFIQYNESQGGIFSHGNFLSGQYDPQTKFGGIIEYTFRVDGEDVYLDGMRLMPTYNVGMPESAEYLVVPLADAEEYGLADADTYFNEIAHRMTTYTNNVEVVEYLD